MARLGWSVVLAAVLVAGIASAARADADPASDTLYVRDVFLPYEHVSRTAADDLRSAARSARAGGQPIKVAVIASKRDLGGVPSLFGNPLYYARFLGAELQFLYSGKLLVVMPQGAGLSERGRLIADPSILHAKVAQGTDGLVRTAAALVRDLTSGEEGGSRKVVPSTGGGSPTWIWVVAAAVGVLVLAAIAFLLARVRRRRPA